MNMPMHIMAKPAQMATGTLSSSIWEIGCSSEGGAFSGNTDEQNHAVQDRKSQGIPRQAEDERKDRDLADDNRVIGMFQEAIRTALHQRRSGQDDDAGGPAFSQGGQHPDAQNLKSSEKRQPAPLDRAIPGEPPQPTGFQENEVPRTRLPQPSFFPSPRRPRLRFLCQPTNKIEKKLTFDTKISLTSPN